MTRINTNVSSLIARTNLGRSTMDLQTALTRLSTGLRINSGRDDPAGLIASENLRRDITAVNKAVSNSQRANQMIATADSALGRVNGLLNDIRGLVTEAANTGVMSDEQIAANQLQIDASLEAINRIAKVTTFQGRKLLDGALDFITSAGTNFDRIQDLQIQQGSLGTTGSIAISVSVTVAATQAQVDITNIPAATAASNAFGDVALTNVIQQASGTVTMSNGTFTLSADAGGAVDGAAGNSVDVAITDSGGGGVTAVSFAGGTLTIDIDVAASTTNDVVTAINGSGLDFTAVNGVDGALVVETVADPMSGGRDIGAGTLRITADTAGAAANGVTVTLIEDATVTAGTASASFNGTDLEVRVNGTVSYSDIATELSTLSGYTATVNSSSGDLNYDTTLDAPPAASALAGGVDGSGGLTQDVVFELSGVDGSEVLQFQAGASITQMESAINAMSDATGVTATTSSTTLQVKSDAYGSSAFVAINVISEATGGTIKTAIGEGTRDSGADVTATVNGIGASGDGNALSINTSTLDVKMTMDAGFTGISAFTITGGGALFQLGPSVVSNQQARLGIASFNTAQLRGISGRLYQLGSGEAYAAGTDPGVAAKIVDQVIGKVIELRGRLGAFQRTTLDTNIAALQDTVSTLTEAESQIRDADFAVESSRLTRAQILVQAGTATLQIANTNPQNVLALLR